MAVLHERAVTHQERLQQLWDNYDYSIQNGTYNAYSWRIGLCPLILVFGFLLLPKCWSGPRVRYSAALLAMVNCAYVIRFMRAKHSLSSALVGLLYSWLILLVFGHLIAVDPKTAYARIQRVQITTDKKNVSSHSSKGNGLAEQSKVDLSATQQTLVDTTQNELQAHIIQQPPSGSTDEDQVLVTYEWQYFPSTLRERLPWALDLLTNIEGVGWTWSIRSLPPPPKHVQLALHRAITPEHILQKWRASKLPMEFMTKSQKLRYLVLRLVLYCVAVDCYKALTSSDPYFWGYVDHYPPSYLPTWLHSPSVILALRIHVTILAIRIGIEGPLDFRTCCNLAFHITDIAGVRSEAWMSPNSFGSFQSVLDDGLIGFWSTYWHQSFRYTFTQPSDFLINNLKLDPRGTFAKILRILLAFFCSGILHASLSYTTNADTSPIRGPMLFFLLQPFGIVLQLYMNRCGNKASISRSLRWTLNFIWCCVWASLVGPLLLDDLAKGGQYLIEPFPYSPSRFLIFGSFK